MVSEAQEVILELTDGRYNYSLAQFFKLSDPSYKNTDSFKQSEDWKKKEGAILTSLAGRIKETWIREEKVVASGVYGTLSSEIVYERETTPQLFDRFYVRYKVLSTRPDGETKITENSKIIVKESQNPH